MKIIILGAGQVGRTAAYHLAREAANEVTVVDVNDELLRDLQDRLDIRTLVGSGTQPSVLEAAGARVRQARAALRSARADWAPTLNVGASATRRTSGSAGSDADVTAYDAGFDAAYEVDLFGGARRSVQASSADLAATEADLHAIQLSLAAEVARVYLDARLAQRRLEIATANLASQDETLQIVDWRVQAGLVGALDLEQARQFLKVAGVTGIVLTKLDGTAKGGIAVAIAKELTLPIRYAGIGEQVDDLVVFDPQQYVNSLFGN